jgi:hypothetical protein
VGNPKRKRTLARPRIIEIIILKWDFRNWKREYGLDYGGSGFELASGTCESCNET